MCYLSVSAIISVKVRRKGDTPRSVVSEDKAVGISGFADGSFQKIDFFADGAISSPEEPVEVFLAAHVLKVVAGKRTEFVGPGFKQMDLWQQDEGEKACTAHFCRAFRRGLLV